MRTAVMVPATLHKSPKICPDSSSQEQATIRYFPTSIHSNRSVLCVAVDKGLKRARQENTGITETVGNALASSLRVQILFSLQFILLYARYWVLCEVEETCINARSTNIPKCTKHQQLGAVRDEVPAGIKL